MPDTIGLKLLPRRGLATAAAARPWRRLSWFVAFFAVLLVLFTWVAVGAILREKRSDALAASPATPDLVRFANETGLVPAILTQLSFIDASGRFVTSNLDPGGATTGHVDLSKHELIFLKFRQGDARVSYERGGTGLGLALSRSLATLMGGTLQVISTVGDGACFTLALPNATAPRAGHATHRSDLPHASPRPFARDLATERETMKPRHCQRQPT